MGCLSFAPGAQAPGALAFRPQGAGRKAQDRCHLATIAKCQLIVDHLFLVW
jgi:hypothetical protein